MKAPEWSQRFSHKNSIGIFRDAQGQLTHKSMVRSCRISNQSELLWLSSLPARIKKNQLKMKELEWSQGFTIKTQWELSVAMETRVLIRSSQKPYAVNPLPQWCSRWNLITICQLVLRDIDVWKCGLTERRTPARVPYYKLPLSLRLWWAQKKWGYRGRLYEGLSRTT